MKSRNNHMVGGLRTVPVLTAKFTGKYRLGKTGFVQKWEKNWEKHIFTFITTSYINTKTQDDLEMHTYRT